MRQRPFVIGSGGETTPAHSWHQVIIGTEMQALPNWKPESHVVFLSHINFSILKRKHPALPHSEHNECAVSV